MDFAYGAVTLCGPPFLYGSAIYLLCNSLTDLVLGRGCPTTPIRQRHQALPPDSV